MGPQFLAVLTMLGRFWVKGQTNCNAWPTVLTMLGRFWVKGQTNCNAWPSWLKVGSGLMSLPLKKWFEYQCVVPENIHLFNKPPAMKGTFVFCLRTPTPLGKTSVNAKSPLTFYLMSVAQKH